MSKIDNFPYPTPPAKIWGCSLWSRSVMLGSAESETVRLISGEIIFAEFQPIWSRYLNVTDRQMEDRRTDNLPWQYHATRSFARQKLLVGVQLSKWFTVLSIICKIFNFICSITCTVLEMELTEKWKHWNCARVRPLLSFSHILGLVQILNCMLLPAFCILFLRSIRLCVFFHIHAQ